jgi:hypothetical protein
MPRASEYRDAAAHFHAMAESLAREAGERRLVTAARFGLAGPAADQVDVLLSAATDQLTISSQRYTELAHECTRRATICDDYADRLLRYWMLSPVERSLEPYPQRPAAWADT